MPLPALNANIASVRAQFGLHDQDRARNANTPTSNQHETPVQQAIPPSIALSEPIRGLRVGARLLPFPSQEDYDDYVDFFFADINPCHSCVNEADFKRKIENLRRCTFARGDSICFLALNYIIFACADVLREVELVQNPSTRPGWKWFSVADSLLGKRKLNGQADLCLIQFLIYEVRLLLHPPRPVLTFQEGFLPCPCR